MPAQRSQWRYPKGSRQPYFARIREVGDTQRLKKAPPEPGDGRCDLLARRVYSDEMAQVQAVRAR